MARIVRMVVVTSIAAGLVAGSRAEALVFCAKKKKPNVVTTRGDTCKKSENAVSLPIAVGPPGAEGAQGPQGVQGPEGKGLFVIPLTKGGATGSASSENEAREQATPVPLFQKGVLSIYGKCYHNTNANVLNASIFIATTQNGAIFEAVHDVFPDARKGGPLATDFLDPTTGEGNRELAKPTANGNDASSLSSRFFALGPDGTQLTGVVFAGVRQGTAPVGPFGAGDGCVWGGHVVSP